MSEGQPTGVHPDDEALFAWAAGERAGRNEVGAHVADCPACRTAVDAWALARAVVRGDAADPVPAATRARAVALFATAPFLAPAPDALAAVHDAIARVRRLVASATFDSWGALAPGFAGVRGAARGERQLSWSAGEIEIDLQATRGGDVAWTLLGQVAAPEGTAIRTVELAPAGQEDAPVATAVPDEFGGFGLPAGSGAWDLLVRLDDALVVLPGLEVG